MHAVGFHEFDFGPRHCWELKDGTYVKDGSSERCDDWRNHPLKAGTSEYLRFIRAFGELVSGIVTQMPEGWLVFGDDFSDTYRVNMYCENYGNKLKAFLDVANETACVEIYDKDLLEAAEAATIAVANQYKEMESENV